MEPLTTFERLCASREAGAMPSTKGGLRSCQVSYGGPIPSLMIQAWADDIFLVNGTREEVCWGLLRKVSLWVERDAISSSAIL